MHDAVEAVLHGAIEVAGELGEVILDGIGGDSRDRRRSKTWRRVLWGLGAALLLVLLWWIFA